MRVTAWTSSVEVGPEVHRLRTDTWRRDSVTAGTDNDTPLTPWMGPPWYGTIGSAVPWTASTGMGRSAHEPPMLSPATGAAAANRFGAAQITAADMPAPFDMPITKRRRGWMQSRWDTSLTTRWR